MAIVNPPDQKVPPAVAKEIGPATKQYMDEMAFVVYQIFQRTGGGEDNIDNSVNIISQVNVGSINARIEEIKQELRAIPSDDLSWKARFNVFEKTLENQPGVTSILPRLSETNKRVLNLEQATTPSLLPHIDSILKQNADQSHLIATLQGSIGRANAIIDSLLKGLPIVQVEATAEYNQTKFDDVIFADATSGTFDVNFIDPALAFKPFTIINCTGTAVDVTFAIVTGSIVGTTTIGDTEAASFYPRKSASEWREY